MRNRLSCSLIRALGIILLCHAQVLAAAQTNSNPAAVSHERERDECIRNLETIYKAIRAYQADRLDLPMWLSDLVPRHLKDANVLICPVCRRTGAIEQPPLADPKLPSSYLFEFCPVPLGNVYAADPTRTRREWKRLQMGVLGSSVPLVRCRHHKPTLNLSFDGRIYESPIAWEATFTNITSPESLRPAALFGGGKAKAGSRFPARSPKATPMQIDLGRFYNAALRENWLGRTNDNFASAPRGLQVIDGTTFDIRGIVQLAGRDLPKRYPEQTKSIPVNVKCEKLHFLHALAGWTPDDAGTSAGAYVVRFKGNDARVQIPLTCGREVAPWKPSVGGDADGLPRAAWSGDPNPGASGVPALYKTTWVNLAPELEIESIDIISDPNRGGLMVLGISAE
jgi:hypothetical protein